DVRPRPAGLLDCLPAVAGLADDMHVGLRLEDHPKAGPHELLVVGEEDVRHGAGSSGSRACSRQPPSGRGPLSSSPPYRETRSRIPTSPWPLPSPWLRPSPASVTSTSRW